MRWLSGSIPDWSALMREAVRVCRPGGWVQSWEPSAQLISDDETVPADSAMGQWGKFFIEGGRKIGNTFTVVEDELQRKVMEEAGLVDIQEFYFKVSLSCRRRIAKRGGEMLTRIPRTPSAPGPRMPD